MSLDICLIAEQEKSTAGYFTGLSICPGYSIPTPEGMEAIALLARTEGILLEPSYTGKTMAALVAAIRAGELSADQTVVFLHTGGTPALFAYRGAILNMIPAPSPRR